jgi:hypothetical protein
MILIRMIFLICSLVTIVSPQIAEARFDESKEATKRTFDTLLWLKVDARDLKIHPVLGQPWRPPPDDTFYGDGPSWSDGPTPNWVKWFASMLQWLFIFVVVGSLLVLAISR